MIFWIFPIASENKYTVKSYAKHTTTDLNINTYPYTFPKIKIIITFVSIHRFVSLTEDVNQRQHNPITRSRPKQNHTLIHIKHLNMKTIYLILSICCTLLANGANKQDANGWYFITDSGQTHSILPRSSRSPISKCYGSTPCSTREIPWLTYSPEK